jgi:hypothetical protein
MNRMHRSLWNPALSAWVAAPENARARGKRSSRTASVSALTAAMLCGGFNAAHACDAGSAAQLAACIAGTDEVINLMASITLDAQLPVVGRTVAINGNGHTLDGAGQFRGFFIGSGITTVNGLTMQNLHAQGGNGGSEFFPGGGGMGAGGAVFVATGARADLNDVLILDNRATGGNGGTMVFGTTFTMGGGGGMGERLHQPVRRARQAVGVRRRHPRAVAAQRLGGPAGAVVTAKYADQKPARAK